MFEGSWFESKTLGRVETGAERLSHDYSTWAMENPRAAIAAETTAGVVGAAIVAKLAVARLGLNSIKTITECAPLLEKVSAEAGSAEKATGINIIPVALHHQKPWSGLYNAYAEGYGKPNPLASVSAWSWLHGATPKLEGFVAQTTDGKFAGLINFRPIPQALEGVHSGYIEDLYVDPEHRRMGVASKLISSAAGVAKERGWTSLNWITAENNPARSLYDQIASPAKSEIFQLKNSLSSEVRGNQLTSVESVSPKNISDWSSLFARYQGEVRDQKFSTMALHRSQAWLTNPEKSLEALIARTSSGEPIGFVHFREFPRPLHGGSYGGNIHDLYVTPEWRRNGIAKEIVAGVLRIAEERSWDAVRWSVPISNKGMTAFSVKVGNVVKRAGYEMMFE